MRSQDQPLGASSAEGGDAACWLANVCERCGAFNEVPGVPCWRCGGATQSTDPPITVRGPG
jgi:hypothetical protein